MVKRFGFPKSERLKSRKQIDNLFADRKGFSVFPIRVMYRLLATEGETGWQVGVTASKRNFKKAVDRNRIKRLLREAYRLQKATFLEQAAKSNKQGVIFFLYTGKTIASFDTLQTAMVNCLKKLSTIVDSEGAA